MKKILIITYYWPPSGGSGVQRWLKFVKYLVKLDWQPYVYTPSNPSFTIQDPSLQKDVPASVEVIRSPIWEPYDLFYRLSSLTGKKQVKPSDFITTGKKSFFGSVSSWVRGNVFIPDARVFWVKPSVTFLEQFIKKNQIEKIITTGPPHSIHLIGLKLKKKNPSLKWIADFRDPWSEWDLLDTLSLTRFARQRHQILERKVLTTADRVVTIAPYHVDRLEKLSGRKVDLITNGFDEDDFGKVQRVATTKFTIRHIGIVDELRDPRPVMEALKQVALTDAEFNANVTVEFIGNVNSGFKKYIADDEVLSKLVVLIDSIPHSELLKVYGATDLQLLVLAYTAIAPGNLPGKFFEYLASGNPILATGPVKGDAADVLRETQAGEIFERDDRSGIGQSLIRYFYHWKKNETSTERDVSSYTRKKLTLKLSDLLQRL